MLVAAPERWDEACFMLPALRALVATGLKTAVFCHPSQLPLWKTVPGPEIIAIPAKTRDVVETIRHRWQAALLWETGPAADIAAKSGIPRRLGPAADKKLRKRLTHPLSATPGPLDHRVRFYLTAIEEMGIATDRPEFFAPLQNPPETGTVLLSPESDFGPNHEWPPDRWQELARALLDDGVSLKIAATRTDSTAEKLAISLGAEILDASNPGAILPELAKHRILIAADASLPHLAGHAGATCITLFGPNDPQWKRPLGKRHLVLRHHVECAPCLLPKCPLDLRCQQELETERVIHAIRARLATGEAAS